MAQSKFTEDGLYVISQETIDRYVKDFHRPDTPDGHPIDVGAIVMAENPVLGGYLNELIEIQRKHYGDDYIQGLIIGLSVMYNIFRREAIANSSEDVQRD